MKDQTPNHKNNEEAFSEAIKSIAQDIEVNPGFQTRLEKQLMGAHQPARASLLFSTFNRVMSTLGWLAALAFMVLMLNWVIRSIAPPPVPAAQETSTASLQETPSPVSTRQGGITTPMPDDAGYDWRGSKVYLSQPLPPSPAEANVYQLRQDQQVTLEEARAFAGRFGLTGETYTTFDYGFNVDNYYFTDGKQALEVYSNRRFIYTADLAKVRRVTQLAPINDAEQIIRDFLSARGFDFPFKITPSDFFDRYSLEPLAPDGLTIQYESFTFPPMLIQLDNNNEVLSIDATLVDYDPTPLGTYGIISAQEALDILLNDNEQGGKQDFFNSAANPPPQEWYRTHPDNQAITIRGYVFSNMPMDPSKPPFITIDGVPASGNTAGLERLEPSTLIEATGQYRVEAGIRKFNVETWNTNIVEEYIEGTLRREDDQIILTNKDGSGSEYALIDPPADLPLNTDIDNSLLAFSGAIRNGQMDWYYIQFYEDTTGGGGGGGGGGLGFYLLNLSGTPIPFSTSTAQPGTSQSGVEYIVKEGDTVFAIAQSYGVTPDEIVQANDWLSEEHVLMPGRTLIIPGTESTSGPGQYIVQENDTLAAIALNHGLTVEQLVEANDLPDPNQVYVGQVLLIPGLGSSTEQRVENVRGFLSISIHKSADGSQITSYLVGVPDPNTQTFYELEGSNLSELDPYHGLPIVVSGTVRQEAFIPTLSMDSYEIPFPDLQFQILKGTQQVQEIDGQIATLFTTETGETYVEFLTSTSQLNFSIIGSEGDLVQQEVLIVPDETFASYPVIRVFSAGMAISPKNGQPMELPMTADQIPVYDDAANPEVPNTTPPSLTIDSIELEYFVNNPYYQVNDPNYERRSTYIQPVWHFRGHYETGDKFDMLVQALKREYLSPQLSPGITPG